MDSGICQTSTASPAEPGGLPFVLEVPTRCASRHPELAVVCCLKNVRSSGYDLQGIANVVVHKLYRS